MRRTTLASCVCSKYAMFTLNSAETVWKDEPFLLEIFLLPATGEDKYELLRYLFTR